VAQGTIIRNKLNRDTAYFEGEIEIDTSIDAPTIIYAMHKGKTWPWYPNGYTYKFTDSYGNELKSYQIRVEQPDPNHIHV
jgi:hypothetical protein